MIKEPEKVKGTGKERNEGSGSKERTRKEAKSENEANDTSSSSTSEKTHCETDDGKCYFRCATEEYEVTELKWRNRRIKSRGSRLQMGRSSAFRDVEA